MFEVNCVSVTEQTRVKKRLRNGDLCVLVIPAIVIIYEITLDILAFPTHGRGYMKRG
jgi:hypothetical protein